jgi:hypothetical protein
VAADPGVNTKVYELGGVGTDQSVTVALKPSWPGMVPDPAVKSPFWTKLALACWLTPAAITPQTIAVIVFLLILGLMFFCGYAFSFRFNEP